MKVKTDLSAGKNMISHGDLWRRGTASSEPGTEGS